MSEYLATTRLPGEHAIPEGRLAHLMERAVVTVDDYKLSDSDRERVVAALRIYAREQLAYLAECAATERDAISNT